MIRIVAQFDPSRTSLNQRLHWAERKRRDDAAKAAALSGWTQAGSPRAEGPVKVTLVARRGRRMDDDNLITGTKAARDVLFKGLVTPDDGPRYVSLQPVRQESGRRWAGREEVEFLIEPEVA